MNKFAVSLSALAVSLAACVLTGCGAKPEAAGADGARAPVTPASAASGAGRGTAVSVTTQVARVRDFEVVLEAIGSVAPLSSVDVRSQLSSVVTQVHVQEGQFVRAGQLLFTLDTRPDEVNVEKLRAQLAKDEATLADAQRQLARNRDLVARNFISLGALESSQTQVEAQTAAVAADRAALEAARLALGYTRIKANGAGRLGAINVYPGSTVQANQTPLVTITQLDPVAVAFNVPQRYLGVVLGALKAGGAPVPARLADERAAPLHGRVQFVDNNVDAATGTVKVKARFANADRRLWPGAFVKVSLVAQTLAQAVVVPTAAIIQGARGPIVYLAVQDKAVLRPVQVLAAQGEESAVTGVVAGDAVVVEGRQNLRPDAPLSVRVPESKPTDAKAGARAPASAAP